MNILIFSPNLVLTLDRGDALRIYNLAKELTKLGHRVNLVSLAAKKSANSEKLIRDADIINSNIATPFPCSILDKAIGMLWPQQNLGYLRAKKEVLKLIQQFIQIERIDVVHTHSILGSLLLSDIPNFPIVLDLTDSASLHQLREIKSKSISLSFINDYLRLIAYKNSERYLLTRFPTTTVVSSIDQGYLKQLNQQADIRVIPNGVDVIYFSPLANLEEEDLSMVFFGAMSYAPNIDAVLYIYHEILPIIKVKLPSVKIYIVGRDPSVEIQELAKYNNIVVTGFVEDIRPFVQRAGVVLAPMRKGSGIKNKILEAMAMEKAIVTNSMGAESLSDEARKCLLIGNTAEMVANHVVDLLKNPAQRLILGQKGRDVVIKEYSWQGVATQYEKLYYGLIKQ